MITLPVPLIPSRPIFLSFWSLSCCCVRPGCSGRKNESSTTGLSPRHHSDRNTAFHRRLSDIHHESDVLRAVRLRIQSFAGFYRPVEIGSATSELQSLMRISYAVFCMNTKKIKHTSQ